MQEEHTAQNIGTHKMEMTNTLIKTPRELWEELGSYSTLHGFHFTFKSSSRVRRGMWILLMLGSGLLLINQIFHNWRKVVAFQVVLKHQREFRDTLDFPAVSICNQNMMRKSKINGTNEQRYLDLLDLQKDNDLTDPGLNYSLDINSAVRQYGHNLSEMLLHGKCYWPGMLCKAVNFTTFLNYKHGLCYTFNSGKNNKNILKTSESGTASGLSFVINAQPEEYYGPYSREGTGFRVIIHDQRDTPSLLKGSFQISPGYSVELEVKRKEFHSLPAPYPTLCKEQRERNHSQSVCLHNCYTNILLRMCRCKMLGMLYSKPLNFPWCTPWQIRNCIYRSFGIVDRPKYCNCTVQCYRVKYEVKSSFMYFPSQTYWESIVQQGNFSSDPGTIFRRHTWFRQRYVKLSVFYGDLDVEISTEEPAYDFTDLASDLGGSMGLFLGCSVLTLFEFIDILILMCISHWRRRRQAKATDLKTSK